MQLPEPVRRIIHESVAASQAEVVDIVMRGTYRKPVLEVFLDAPGAVTTDVCADVSRRISAALDGQRLISEEYRLEVSSPGLDRPLLFLWQFGKHQGRQFRISVNAPAGPEEVKGTLTGVEEGVIILKGPAETEVRVRFEDIREARIVLPW